MEENREIQIGDMVYGRWRAGYFIVENIIQDEARGTIYICKRRFTETGKPINSRKEERLYKNNVSLAKPKLERDIKSQEDYVNRLRMIEALA